MPDISGMELYRRLMALKPYTASRIIFLSGDTENPDIRGFLMGTA